MERSLHPSGAGRVAAALLVGLSLCGRATAGELEVRSFTLPVPVPTGSALWLQNRGPAPVLLEPVSWNGYAVHHELATLRAEVDALPPEADGSLATRIFRFVADNRRHGYPLTLNFGWLLSPTLFFNSSGVALCGEVAELVYLMASDRGLSARVWRLGGHLVAEVWSGGRWQMYDPDYGVYFLNRSGKIASVAELAADGTLITNPVVRLAYPGIWSPYTSGYAALFTSTSNNSLRPPPGAREPARRVRFSLPRGASLRLPGHRAPAPLDYLGQPQDLRADYADLTLRLPAGSLGVVENPLIVHTLRGSGAARLGAASFAIGSAELQETIDARADALPSLELLASPSAVELVYLVNPLRTGMPASASLVLRVTPGADLAVRVVPTGAASADTDGDGVSDDGGGNDVVGDTPCANGQRVGCDDGCVAAWNPAQLDADGDGRGNACDADLDQDELITGTDLSSLRLCRMGSGVLASPGCRESDLDEDGDVDGADEARLLALATEAGGLVSDASAPPGCGLGPELVPVLLALQAAFAAARRRTAA